MVRAFDRLTGAGYGWSACAMCVRRVLALVLSLLFVGAASASARSVTYQATPAHDGHVADPSLAPPLALRWDRRLSGEVSYPLVADGRVFVTTSTPGGLYGSTLHALSMADGGILWQRALGGTYYRVGIAYYGGRVFTVDFDGMCGRSTR